jgi:hypothetical protein
VYAPKPSLVSSDVQALKMKLLFLSFTGQQYVWL